jgi:uncharacterized repeat protein (TIGR03803 family)
VKVSNATIKATTGINRGVIPTRLIQKYTKSVSANRHIHYSSSPNSAAQESVQWFGGNLYGTNYSGGIANAGTVFKLTPAGVETVLHSFVRNGADGINPYASLILHTGNFYGTTLQGGPANVGTVFKVTPVGTETVLYKFTGGADGGYPLDC